ncbi:MULTISPECIES: carbohydrate-binding protein [unclassified Flagellimonas]|uniref:carbohydrate-binding protein n=1 Tax=unclassified Flagellimonas TaxID=2644544 RepID=UPI00272DFE3F|nr:MULTISPECIES: carbohydrate-binding protein [unclassified Flagellimonas]
MNYFENFFLQIPKMIIACCLLFLIGCSDSTLEEDIETNAQEEFIVAELTTGTIQAENYDAQSGINIVNGSKVGYVENNDWIRFEDFDFSGAASVSVRAASDRSGGRIEFRAGGPSSDLLGTVNISNTGGWNAMQTFTGSMNDNSNNSDLYLVFKGGSGYLFDVDSFSFSGSGSTPPSGNASIPSDLMPNCNQWKITYPDGSEDKTLCGEGNNEYFFVNGSGNGIVFRAPIRTNNGTTPNSDYVRSEFRERKEDGSSDIYWNTNGKHFIYVKQAITHLPIVKDHLVATQIHGNKAEGIDDAMVLRLEGDHLFLSFNGEVLRSDLTIKRGYSLGTVHEVIFEVINGRHYCYYSEDGNLKSAYNSGSASSYLVKDGGSSVLMDIDYGDAYFKIGNYTQSNANREGSSANDPDNYGEVVVYDYDLDHTN